jgi:hypothetical protein
MSEHSAGAERPLPPPVVTRPAARSSSWTTGGSALIPPFFRGARPRQGPRARPEPGESAPAGGQEVHDAPAGADVAWFPEIPAWSADHADRDEGTPAASIEEASTAEAAEVRQRDAQADAGPANAAATAPADETAAAPANEAATAQADDTAAAAAQEGTQSEDSSWAPAEWEAGPAELPKAADGEADAGSLTQEFEAPAWGLPEVVDGEAGEAAPAGEDRRDATFEDAQKSGDDVRLLFEVPSNFDIMAAFEAPTEPVEAESTAADEHHPGGRDLREEPDFRSAAPGFLLDMYYLPEDTSLGAGAAAGEGREVAERVAAQLDELAQDLRQNGMAALGTRTSPGELARLLAAVVAGFYAREHG